MAYPTIYGVTYSYTGFQQAQGDNSFPGTQIDADFAGLEASVADVAAFMQNVIRSDGALQNGVVTYDSLSASLQTAGLSPATAWVTSTAYAAGVNVAINGLVYRCLVAHTSGVFATDLAAGKWVFVASFPVNPTPALGPTFTLTATTGEILTFGGSLNRFYIQPNANVPIEFLNFSGVGTGFRFYMTDSLIAAYIAGTSRVIVDAASVRFLPDGVNQAVSIAPTVMQLHYDNIVLGRQSAGVVTNWPGITWKVPDYDNSNGGFDHPLGSVAANASAFVVQAGADGPSNGSASLPMWLTTHNSVGAETVQVSIAATDMALVGVGTANVMNDIQAATVQINAPDGTMGAHVHFTNPTTGSTGTDGFYVGINASEQPRIWNYENTDTLFGTNNQQVAILNTTGLAIGVGGATNDTLQLYKSAAGAVTHGLRASTNNTASGETHTTRFSIQDNGAGVIRTLFYAAGPLNAGVNDQADFAVFSEGGTLLAARFTSLNANGGTQILGYDRANAIKLTLAGGGTSTFAGGGVTVSGGALLSTHATAGLGYGTGAGGSATQITSRTTSVTVNKPSGAITLFSAAGSTSPTSVTVTCSAVAATDTVVVNQKSGADKYEVHVTAVAAGSFVITFWTTGGTTVEQPVFNFNVIKGVIT